MNTGKKKYILFLMFICFHVLLAGPVFAGDTAHPWYRLQGELPAIIESVDENIISVKQRMPADWSMNWK